VLLHGLGGNGPGNFAYLGPYLASAGFCVFASTYGEGVPGIPVGGLTPIPQSATEIAAFIHQVLAATGAAKADLVGHSEGGFQALYGPKFVPGEAGSIASVVALAPPTHGTTFANLVTIGDDLGLSPVADAIIASGCPACTELITGSDLVASLNTGLVAQQGIDYTIIASTHDELVTPYGTEFVKEHGVDNETVQNLCPLDPVGHIGLAYDPDVARLVRNALDPAHPVPVTCTVGPPV
jgi:triacylglycerol esterase/lipase EstA (alpha/beta hydrolase family)